MIYILWVYDSRIGHYSTMENAEKARDNYMKNFDYKINQFHIEVFPIDSEFFD